MVPVKKTLPGYTKEFVLIEKVLVRSEEWAAMDNIITLWTHVGPNTSVLVTLCCLVKKNSEACTKTYRIE